MSLIEQKTAAYFCSFAVAALAAASCGGSRESTAVPEPVIDSGEKELFFESEDAIGRCMRERGFDYQQRTFVSTTAATSGRDNPGAESIGYGGTFAALLTMFADLGQPSPNLSMDEVAAYQVALHGSSAAPGESEQSDSSETDGCKQVGEAIWNGEPSESSPAAPTLSDDEILRLTPAWEECIMANGYEISSAEPTGLGPDFQDALSLHFLSRYEYYLSRAAARLGSLASEDPMTWSPSNPDFVPKVADAAWVSRIVAADDELEQILLDEREEAVAEVDCVEKVFADDGG